MALPIAAPAPRPIAIPKAIFLLRIFDTRCRIIDANAFDATWVRIDDHFRRSKAISHEPSAQRERSLEGLELIVEAGAVEAFEVASAKRSLCHATCS